MSHSLNKIWIHAVLGTKKSKPFIKHEFENKVYDFLKKQLMELGCYVEIINGMPDHIHVLFVLNRSRSVSEVMKQLKGSSSHWINAEKLTLHKFEWQVGYGAFSVSEFNVDMVTNYIKRQKEHHANKTYSQEILSLNSLISP